MPTPATVTLPQSPIHSEGASLGSDAAEDISQHDLLEDDGGLDADDDVPPMAELEVMENLSLGAPTPEPSPPPSADDDDSYYIFAHPATMDPEHRSSFTKRFVHHDLPAMHRMAYTTAAVSSILGATSHNLSQSLEGHSAIIREHLSQTGGGTNGDREPAGTSTDPAEAYRKLGMDADIIIQQYAVCRDAACCHLVPVSQLDALGDEEHTKADGTPCSLPMYRMEGRTRQPFKVLAHTPFSATLQCFMRDAAFVEALQHWRTGPDDAIGIRPPVTRVMDREARLNSVHDGQMWRSRSATSSRQVGATHISEGDSDEPQMLVSLEFGLVAAVNVDWFAVKDVKDCSIGAAYVTILNLPRELFFKPWLTTLALVIPGPNEPSLLAMNRVLTPLIKEIKRLESGLLMYIAGREQPELVRVQLAYSSSDIPATRKLTGSLSHASARPCNHCTISKDDINTDAAYDWKALPLRDSQETLDAAARHRTGSTRQRSTIENQHHVRWSETCRLLGFEHSSFAPVDAMHALALGVTKALVVWLIKKSGLFDQEGDDDGVDRLAAFESVLTRVTWPSHVGRLPQKVVRSVINGNGDSLKADEWNRVRAVLPLALAKAFHDMPNTIRKRAETVYRAVLKIVAAIRQLFARSISIEEAEGAVEYFARGCRELMRAGMSLSINWHLVMHLPHFIELYGPVGGFSTWSYERNNGLLASTRFFKGGTLQMVSTAARRWLKSQLVYAILSNPAPNASPVELEFNSKMRMALTRRQAQGTLRSEATDVQLQQTELFVSHRFSRKVSLGDGNGRDSLYQQTFSRLKALLPELSIKRYDRPFASGLPLPLDKHEEFGTIEHQSFRLQSMAFKQATRDHWCIGRAPDGGFLACRVERIIRLNLPEQFGDLEEQDINIAVVRFLPSCEEELQPWSNVSTTLGYTLHRALEEDQPPTVVAVADLRAPVAICPTETEDGLRYVAMSYDKANQDLDVYVDVDADATRQDMSMDG